MNRRMRSRMYGGVGGVRSNPARVRSNPAPIPMALLFGTCQLAAPRVNPCGRRAGPDPSVGWRADGQHGAASVADDSLGGAGS